VLRLTAPEKVLERDDPVPEHSPTRRRQGLTLLRQAIQAIGGDKLMAIKSIRLASAGESQGTKVAKALVLRFPDQARTESSWGRDCYAKLIDKDMAFFDDAGAVRAMTAAQARVMHRDLARHPLVILRATNRPDFVCEALGEGEIAGRKLTLVRVAFDGATTTLGLDPESHRILAVRHLAWGGPGFALGEQEVVFSDFRTVDGLTLPFARSVHRFAGAAIEDAKTITWDEIQIDPELPDGYFARPRPAK